MPHFHPRLGRGPLLMRAPRRQDISGPWQILFGIALSRLRTEWAAKQGVSETIAAAVYLLSENRRAEEVVGELNPSELERVIDVIGTSLTAFRVGPSPVSNCRLH